MTSTTKDRAGASPAKARTQAELIAYLAERSGLDRKKVKALLAALTAVAVADLNRADKGRFTIPGLVTLRVVRKPATQQHEGLNPFSRKPMTFAARPARNVIKTRYPKKLRDSIA
jgi:nucleoid DNA-binding protein